MTKTNKPSMFFMHKKGHGTSKRTRVYGEYMDKKNKGLISKQMDFETFCKNNLKSK